MFDSISDSISVVKAYAELLRKGQVGFSGIGYEIKDNKIIAVPGLSHIGYYDEDGHCDDWSSSEITLKGFQGIDRSYSKRFPCSNCGEYFRSYGGYVSPFCSDSCEQEWQGKN